VAPRHHPTSERSPDRRRERAFPRGRRQSATIEVVDEREAVLQAGRFGSDRAGYRDMPGMPSACHGAAEAAADVTATPVSSGEPRRRDDTVRRPYKLR
jgi:hypothetical protein